MKPFSFKRYDLASINMGGIIVNGQITELSLTVTFKPVAGFEWYLVPIEIKHKIKDFVQGDELRKHYMERYDK